MAKPTICSEYGCKNPVRLAPGKKSARCQACRKHRKIIYQILYAEERPLTPEQQREERERRMTCRVGY